MERFRAQEWDSIVDCGRCRRALTPVRANARPWHWCGQGHGRGERSSYKHPDFGFVGNGRGGNLTHESVFQ